MVGRGGHGGQWTKWSKKHAFGMAGTLLNNDDTGTCWEKLNSSLPFLLEGWRTKSNFLLKALKGIAISTWYINEVRQSDHLRSLTHR